MNKPRVIIADFDVSYVIPLQARFVEEFEDRIDLEIITDKAYLDELFLSPQNVFLLIISERMYREDFARHGIEHIYILTENSAGAEDKEITAKYIFKYTSVKEIFTRVVSTCFRDNGIQNEEDKSTKVVAVCAGKGGMGKTTIALGIAGYLSQNYKRVLYVNVAELQSFQYYMENATPISDGELYVKLRGHSGAVYKEVKSYLRKETCYYLPPLMAPLFSMGLDFSLYTNLIREARESREFDYIIVDVDTGFDENLMNILDMSDRAIFLTEQSYAAAMITNRVAENIGGVGTEKYVFVCNKYDALKENCLVESGIKLKYSVATYIDQVADADEMRVSEFLSIRGVDKLAYHII